jgi:hypothetical protein
MYRAQRRCIGPRWISLYPAEKVNLHIMPQHPFSKPFIFFLEWGMASLPVMV